MNVTFWGVRGSTPGCNMNQQAVGGHTSCVSLECDQGFIIIDGGSGLVNLGDWLLTSRHRLLHIFMSHVHLDHVLGLPFFKPFWHDDFTIHLYAGPLCESPSLQHFFKHILFKHPLFPVIHDNLKASIHFHTVGLENSLKDVPLSVDTISLNHPGGALGYRFSHNNISMSYLSDMEHTTPTPDADLIKFVHKTDLIIYDATYTDEEYEKFKGWGHSTWQEGIKLAQLSQSKQVAFFHHAPHHTDDDLNHIEKCAKHIFPSSFVARQGLKVIL